MVKPTASVPAKELYEIVQGFWHRGVFAATGFKIALTEAEAKNLLTGGNVRRIAANDATPVDPTDPAPAAIAPALVTAPAPAPVAEAVAAAVPSKKRA